MPTNYPEDTPDFPTTPELPHDPLDRPCPFITFYSFKGGVGRSMALINVAGILAARGFRVLVIDLDLEAPGLSFLARHAAPNPETSQQEGFIDCLLDAIDRTDDADLFRLPPSEAINRFCAPYPLPDTFNPSPGASLHIMPAGRLANDYAKRLERLGLGNLYRDGVGLSLIMVFKQKIQDGRRFDYVFIDSRTGFSDESGICTRDLADALVVLSGLNTQNVEGTARFLGALRRTADLPDARPRSPLTVVLSPVPNGEDALVDERETVAAQKFTEAWGGPIAVDLHIPYHPMLALTEDPHIFRRRKGHLFDAYRRLEQQLRIMLGDTWEPWAERARVALVAEDYQRAEANLRRARLLADPEHSTVWIDRFANRLTIRSKALAAPEAEALYAFIIEHASQPAREALADHLGNYAIFLWEERKDTAAEAIYRRALAAEPRDHTHLGNFGGFLLATGRIAEGLTTVDDALALRGTEAIRNALDAECWMYLLCCAPPERRPEALTRLRDLIETYGIRTGTWDFTEVIAQATQLGHPDAAWLPLLADVLASRQLPAALADWPAWQAAKPEPKPEPPAA